MCYGCSILEAIVNSLAASSAICLAIISGHDDIQTENFYIYNKLPVCATYEFLNLAVLLILSLISS